MFLYEKQNDANVKNSNVLWLQIGSNVSSNSMNQKYNPTLLTQHQSHLRHIYGPPNMRLLNRM